VFFFFLGLKEVYLKTNYMSQYSGYYGTRIEGMSGTLCEGKEKLSGKDW